MVSLNDLLPDFGSAPGCASFTESLNADPVGSAFYAHLVVLVEVSLPWPKPVRDHPLLDGVLGLMRTAALPTRILACEPFREAGADGADSVGADSVGVVVFRFDGAGYVRTDTVVAAGDLVSTVAAECADASLAIPEPAAARRAVLVCTQGSHDICCGELGVPLADGATERHPDVDVFRVSHTGGHRFAPTALSMPDGRMWAFLSADDLDAVLTRSGSPADLQQKCRGWIGAKGGAAQAGERAVFAVADWQWDTTPRLVDATPQPDESQMWDVSVRTTPEQAWVAQVGIGRELPTISCSQPGGLPAKPGREYAVLSLEASTPT